MSETISKKDGITEVRKACDMFSDMYFHMAKVLYERFGAEEAKAVLTEAIATRGAERGRKFAAKAKELGLECNDETLSKITDFPFLGWAPSYGEYVCPIADNWSKRFGEYPWFAELAPLFCDVSDEATQESYTGVKTKWVMKRVLRGDGACARVPVPADE